MPHAAGIVALVPAIVAALKASGALVALLDSADAVYEGRAPNPTSGAQPSKYLVVTMPSYVPTAVLHSDGADNAVEIHIWYPGGRNVPVLAIVKEIAIALDGVALSLSGARHWTGEAQLIAITDDTSITPSGKHGIVQYFSRTQ